jgi:SAM-dependent methyltransferase
MSHSDTCPLCGARSPEPFARVLDRDYLACSGCGLVFMAPLHRPGPEAERARYETHENDPSDPRYRAFLDRLCTPLAEHLSPGAHGLDYGSGPGPTLSAMMRERGFPMRDYDPYFAPDPGVLEGRFDFITCSETVEHFFHPRTEFERMDRLLRPGGWVGIMTGMFEAERPFESWYYVRDPTHVCFWRRETFDWVAEWLGWEVAYPVRDVALFRKPEG